MTAKKKAYLIFLDIIDDVLEVSYQDLATIVQPKY